MTASSFNPTRRQILAGLAATTALPALPAFAQDTPRMGGLLTIATGPVPAYLNSAINTGGGEALASGKMIDGLCTYAEGMQPQPSLAKSWEISEDGLTMTFNLRDDVTWHDGEPFTSEDVKVTIMEIIKVFHGRGRTTFAAVTEVETPDEHTAVFKLDQPAPAIMAALNAQETPIMPAHIYAGTDIMQNPANLAPIGTGPFKFVRYDRGSVLEMEKNENYWQEDKPRIDKLIFRYNSDTSTSAAMLESGEADLVPSSQLPTVEILRFQTLDGFEVNDAGYEHTPSVHLCDFNLRRQMWQDKRVRQALAYVTDNNWIAQNVWFGLADPGTGPIHIQQKAFYTTEGVPSYEYNKEKAEALLDEAGYPRDSNGTRFSMVIDANAYGEEPIRAAEYMRQQFSEIGVDAQVRVNDTAAFATRVYTDNDFDLTSYTASAGADPAIGVQRFYWSENIKPGVAFSNGSGYSNPEVDAVLEQAAVEIDLEKRQELYYEFQRLVMEDVPVMQLVYDSKRTIANTHVKDYVNGAISTFGTFADVWIAE